MKRLFQIDNCQKDVRFDPKYQTFNFEIDSILFIPILNENN